MNRAVRLQKLILRELTPAVRSLKDPELSGFLTLTEVRLSKDLKTATVYYSVFGTQEEQRRTGRALERSQGFLRHSLGSRIRMRRIPTLNFSYDSTPEQAERVERILDQLGEERKSSTHATQSEDPETPSSEGNPKG